MSIPINESFFIPTQRFLQSDVDVCQNREKTVAASSELWVEKREK